MKSLKKKKEPFIKLPSWKSTRHKTSAAIHRKPFSSSWLLNLKKAAMFSWSFLRSDLLDGRAPSRKEEKRAMIAKNFAGDQNSVYVNTRVNGKKRGKGG